MTRSALAVLLLALLSASARPASADPIELPVSFELVNSSNPIDPRDWDTASFSYDPDTHRGSSTG